ncbi:MAG: hypothetical protein AB7F89_24030, partial [Pirellulaceae bacterium]
MGIRGPWYGAMRAVASCALVVGGGAALMQGVSSTRAESARSAVTILNPKRDGTVGRSADVIMKANIPGQPVVLVRPESTGGVWYIQPPAETTGRGYFKTTARFGNERTAAGQRFQLLAVLIRTPAEWKLFEGQEHVAALPESLIHSPPLSVVLESPVSADRERAGERRSSTPPARFVLQPVDQSKVTSRMEVRGKVAAEEWPVVLVRYDAPNESWWVQGPATLNGEREFVCAARFGNEATPSGHRFRVIVLAVPDRTRASEFPVGRELRELPADLPHTEEIVVVLDRPAAVPAFPVPVTNPTAPLPRDSSAVTPPSDPLVRRRAMWVWSAAGVRDDASELSRLIDFCRREGIGELWTQLTYQLERHPIIGSARGVLQCHIHHAPRWRNLLRRAHEQRLRVHALDGAPEFALSASHDIPLAVADAVLAFNLAADRSERFDGIHFDNEPYLLLGWEDEVRRSQILQDYRLLNEACARRAASYRNTTGEDFEFGIDMPFWWPAAVASAQNSTPGFAPIAMGSATCLDLVQHVGVMDYRDQAEGADGIIAHAWDVLERAQQAGQADVYVGLETARPQAAHVWFVLGLPRAEFVAALRGPARRFADLSRVEEFRLRHFDDGESVHVGLELPDAPNAVQLQSVKQTLREIAAVLGAGTLLTGDAKLSDRLAQACARLEQEGGWTDVSIQPLESVTGREGYVGFTGVCRSPSKITFGDDSEADFRAAVQSAEHVLSSLDRFAGRAVHSYESYPG